MDAFDADVLIYAATPQHEYSQRLRRLLRPSGLADGPTGEEPIGVGSLLLLPELLSKPIRTKSVVEIDELSILLGRLDLLPVDRSIALLATQLGANYRLKAADAIHLATAVAAGADRFVTNNRRDFDLSIDEIDVTYPEQL